MVEDVSARKATYIVLSCQKKYSHQRQLMGTMIKQIFTVIITRNEVLKMGYSREEQETTLVFDNNTGKWNVYSTVPKHIRKLSKLTEIFTVESENDRPIAVKCTLLEKQVSMKKERVMSEEQRQKAAERMAKARRGVKRITQVKENWQECVHEFETVEMPGNCDETVHVCKKCGISEI